MFSVVIPAYNCQKTIATVLDSVRCQSRLDLIEEIILINDGSTDATDQAIQTYLATYPDLPIRYVKQDNHGVSYTRNKGIRMARAEWIALLDADDAWHQTKIERQHIILQENPHLSFLGSSFPLKVIWKKRTGLCKLSARDLCWRSMPSTPSIVFKKQVGIELGLFDEGVMHCEDIQFFQKFLLKDSYYVLAEDLLRINIGKAYHGVSGLSANLDGMHQGRQRNTRELQQMGLISKPFMSFILVFNHLKLLRRKTLRQIARLRQGR